MFSGVVQHLIERIHQQNCEHVLVLMSEIMPHRLRLMPQIDACASLLFSLLICICIKWLMTMRHSLGSNENRFPNASASCRWVQIACPRLSIDWGTSYDRPLLNPYEACIIFVHLFNLFHAVLKIRIHSYHHQYHHFISNAAICCSVLVRVVGGGAQ